MIEIRIRDDAKKEVYVVGKQVSFMEAPVLENCSYDKRTTEVVFNALYYSYFEMESFLQDSENEKILKRVTEVVMNSEMSKNGIFKKESILLDVKDIIKWIEDAGVEKYIQSTIEKGTYQVHARITQNYDYYDDHHGANISGLVTIIANKKEKEFEDFVLEKFRSEEKIGICDLKIINIEKVDWAWGL